MGHLQSHLHGHLPQAVGHIMGQGSPLGGLNLGGLGIPGQGQGHPIQGLLPHIVPHVLPHILPGHGSPGQGQAAPGAGHCGPLIAFLTCLFCSCCQHFMGAAAAQGTGQGTAQGTGQETGQGTAHEGEDEGAAASANVWSPPVRNVEDEVPAVSEEVSPPEHDDEDENH